MSDHDKPRNIILCADGTGNKGGYTTDSNVYKIYNAIDIHDPACPQITFYDNGVGTASNKYWRGLSGAFGFGFKRNVCDLYEFLARNYEPAGENREADRVFLFGFSRGAATVRAFSGFIDACGLIDGRMMEPDELKVKISEAFKIYQGGEKKTKFGKHGVIEIKCVGVWDTVSALGFPKKWDVFSLGMGVLQFLCRALDTLSDKFVPHNFYNYELTHNVEFGYQALAIDDERLSFSPMVWDESGRSRDNVVQVWFAGAHSNVGGGYRRAGLANVTLHWMMKRVEALGLNFKDGELAIVRGNANAQGRLYNSRDGLAIYYRYHPRPIAELCKNKIKRSIKIHRSVLERMQMATADYAPGHLPYEFELVDSDIPTAVETVRATKTKDAWMNSQNKVGTWVKRRKILYVFFLESTLAIVGVGIWFWMIDPRQDPTYSEYAGPLAGLVDHIADILNYFSPTLFEGLVAFAVLQKPLYFMGAVAFFLLLLLVRILFRQKNNQAAEAARRMLVTTYKQELKSTPAKGPGSDAVTHE